MLQCQCLLTADYLTLPYDLLRPHVSAHSMHTEVTSTGTPDTETCICQRTENMAFEDGPGARLAGTWLAAISSELPQVRGVQIANSKRRLERDAWVPWMGKIARTESTEGSDSWSFRVMVSSTQEQSRGQES